MIDLIHLVLPESDFGRALLNADKNTGLEHFKGFIDTKSLEEKLPSYMPEGHLQELAIGESALAFLDEKGERQNINSFCDLITFEKADLDSLLRQILLARQIILDADRQCFDKGLWLINRQEPAQHLSTLLSFEDKEDKAKVVYLAYELLASLEPEFGSPPLILNGSKIMSQLDFMQNFLMDTDSCVGWVKPGVDVLVVTGFKSVWWPEEKPSTGPVTF